MTNYQYAGAEGFGDWQAMFAERKTDYGICGDSGHFCNPTEAPHILILFQRSVGIHLAGPDAALLDEIADFPQTPGRTVSHDVA